MTGAPWLAFVPRDTILVRDGRSFDAAADASAQTVLPGPATTAGAVGAAFGTNPDEVRGPVLARREGSSWEPYFPAPADLVVTTENQSRVFRMTSQDTPGHTDLGTAGAPPDSVPSRWLMPPEHAEPVEPLRGWVPARVLAEYLLGAVPAADGTPIEDFALADPLCEERRVGLAREGRSARTGFLYQATHWRPEENWAFLAQYVVPPDWDRQARSPVKFGGRGRLADPEPAGLEWPGHPVCSVRGKVLVYLATAALWPEGWRIPVPAGARLIAAATADAEPVATLTPGERWRETRALRWGVPAGSVFLLEFSDPQRGAEWAADVHGSAYGRDEKDQLRTAGFGLVLTGVWA